MSFSNKYIASVYEAVEKRNAGEAEFLQAVREVLETIEPVIEKRPDLQAAGVVERIVEPERFIQFRVQLGGRQRQGAGQPRASACSSIPPSARIRAACACIRRSTPRSSNSSALNRSSRTRSPACRWAAAKAARDFDPKGKSDMEIMRFCQSFMTELSKHIGADTDVPAGDIGVGAREIGYMFGQYKRLANEFTGVLTGKGLTYGGSLARTEATGYGLCYFVREMLAAKGDSFKGKTVVISGSGNVAIYATQKATELGGKVVALSDSSGYVYDPNGINLDVVKQIKEVERLRISEYAKRVSGATFTPGCSGIWTVKCDIALPCATQNEIDASSAEILVKNGCKLVAEGANMPSTPEAIECFQSNGVMFGPAKAANAGGVATSGLEMSQNSLRLSWSFEEVDAKLDDIMKGIYKAAYDASVEYGCPGNLVAGANIAGFLKVAEAMKAQGVAY